jgi:mutator protein MutT
MDRPATLREIDVAAGLVFREGQLLIAQRRPGDSLGGFWEFPGGKRHAGERFEDCLRRELLEELGIEVEVGPLYESITHRYPEVLVNLRFFRCRWVRHEPQALGCACFAWVNRETLRRYRFPPADARLLERLVSERGAWESAPSAG